MQPSHVGFQTNSGFSRITALSPEGKDLNYLLDGNLAPRYVSETPITVFAGVEIDQHGQRQTQLDRRLNAVVGKFASLPWDPKKRQPSPLQVLLQLRD